MRTRHTVTALFGLAALLGVTSAARADEVAHVTMPVPFVVNQELLPAGQYDVRTDSQDPAILIFCGINGTKGYALVNTMPEYGGKSTDDHPAVTLVRKDGQFQLQQVRQSRDYARDVLGR